MLSLWLGDICTGLWNENKNLKNVINNQTINWILNVHNQTTQNNQTMPESTSFARGCELLCACLPILHVVVGCPLTCCLSLSVPRICMSPVILSRLLREGEHTSLTPLWTSITHPQTGLLLIVIHYQLLCLYDMYCIYCSTISLEALLPLEMLVLQDIRH